MTTYFNVDLLSSLDSMAGNIRNQEENVNERLRR